MLAERCSRLWDLLFVVSLLKAICNESNVSLSLVGIKIDDLLGYYVHFFLLFTSKYLFIDPAFLGLQLVLT